MKAERSWPNPRSLLPVPSKNPMMAGTNPGQLSGHSVNIYQISHFVEPPNNHIIDVVFSTHYRAVCGTWSQLRLFNRSSDILHSEARGQLHSFPAQK